MDIQNFFVEGKKNSLFYDKGDVLATIKLNDNVSLNLVCYGEVNIFNTSTEESLKRAKDVEAEFKNDDELNFAIKNEKFFIESNNWFELEIIKNDKQLDCSEVIENLEDFIKASKDKEFLKQYDIFI